MLIYVLNDHAVRLLDAILLVSAYACYVVVCAFYSKLIGCCCPNARVPDESYTQACALWEPSVTRTAAPALQAGNTEFINTQPESKNSKHTTH